MINKIKKILLAFILFFLFSNKVSAKENVKLYLFHNYDCPHCAEEQKYLDTLEDKYDNLEIIKYEVKKDEENKELLTKFLEKVDWEVKGVPFTVIGSTYFVGYNDDISSKIRCAIEYYSDHEHRNIVGEFLENGEIDEFEQDFDTSSCEFKIPIIGSINPKNISLPLVSIVIGFVDGFNPCAMWVLLFLISLMLGMKNSKRMWCLGIAFLMTSAIVYFAFMMAWVNIAGLFSSSRLLEMIIAFVALGGSTLNLYNFYKEMKVKDIGCSVTDKESKKKIMTKAKKIVSENSFILALLGVMLLAISVNVIELACSAGLPILFGQILAMNDLSTGQTLFYNFLYIVFFLIDDIIVFTIAMVSLKLTGISNKYNKYAHLIGGIIMLLIGILMLFFPNILKFNL